MSYSFTKKKRIRKSFGKIESIISIPNLIEVQKNSYERFLQAKIPAEIRTETGLHAVFNDGNVHSIYIHNASHGPVVVM